MDIVGTTGAALQFAVTIFQALQLVDAAFKGKADKPVNTMRTVAAVTEKECDVFLKQNETTASGVANTSEAIQDACAIARHAKAVCQELLRKLAKLHPEKKNPKTLSVAVFSALWSKDELGKSELYLLDFRRDLTDRDAFDAAFATLRIADAKLDKINTKGDTLVALHTTEAALSSTRWDEQAVQKKTDLLLDALAFDGMGKRLGEVPDAAEVTFGWILKQKTSDSKDHGQSTFATWLAQGDGIFHIAGKPGSGKSTLMKYMVEHEDTAALLQQWVGNKKLIQASCFFWKPGTKLQKSTIGLMRTLLHGIVAADYSLAQLLFPDVWDADDVGTKRKLVLSDAKVRSAFKRLADGACFGSGPADYRFCFFIDGLDEFGDNTNDTIVLLIRQLKKLVRSAAGRLKICVSSREYPEIIENLATDEEHRITLQELTRSDIEQLVDSRLQEIFQYDSDEDEDEDDSNSDSRSGSDGYTRGSDDNDSEDNDDDDDRPDLYEIGAILQLRSRILSKAQGVFLWVVLVLGVVEQEAALGAPMNELLQLVEVQHDDLDFFFDAIIRRIEKRNRTKVALMFQYTLDTINNSDYLRSIIWYTFLQEFSTNDDFWKQCENAKHNLSTQDARYARYGQTQKWIKRHCEGLLDFTSEYTTPPRLGDDFHVILSHRSIIEYLTSLLETKWKDVVAGIDRAGIVIRMLHATNDVPALHYFMVKRVELMLDKYFKLQVAPGADSVRMHQNFSFVPKAKNAIDLPSSIATKHLCFEFIRWRNQARPGYLGSNIGTMLLETAVNKIRYNHTLAERIPPTASELLKSGASLSDVVIRKRLWVLLVREMHTSWSRQAAVLTELLVVFLGTRAPPPMWAWTSFVIYAEVGGDVFDLPSDLWRLEPVGMKKYAHSRVPCIVSMADFVSRLDTPRKAELLELVEALEPSKVTQERAARLLKAAKDRLPQVHTGVTYSD